MTQIVLGVYVSQSLWLLSYSIDMLTLIPLPYKFWGVKIFHHFFNFWLHKI